MTPAPKPAKSKPRRWLELFLFSLVLYLPIAAASFPLLALVEFSETGVLLWKDLPGLAGFVGLIWLLFSLAAAACVFFATSWFLGRGQPKLDRWNRLDLSRPSWRSLAVGLGAALATYGLFYYLSALLIHAGLVDSAQSQEIELAVGVLAQSRWGLFWGFIVIGLLFPLIEEIIFRRLFYRSLVDLVPGWLVLPVSAISFGLLHPPLLAMIGATLFAVATILVYRWSGNLWPAVLMHAANNTLALSLVVLEGGTGF